MVKFSCVTICTWRYLSLGICKLHILILMVTGLFKLSISYRVSYRSLCFSKWPVSCKLSNLCVELFVVLLYYPYDVCRICSNIPDFAHLCLLFSFLFNLARSDLSKESAFVSFIFFCYSFLISLISATIISFFLIAWGLFGYSFSRLSR